MDAARFGCKVGLMFYGLFATTPSPPSKLFSTAAISSAVKVASGPSPKRSRSKARGWPVTTWQGFQQAAPRGQGNAPPLEHRVNFGGQWQNHYHWPGVFVQHLSKMVDALRLSTLQNTEHKNL
jgi:hypothetical protein